LEWYNRILGIFGKELFSVVFETNYSFSPTLYVILKFDGDSASCFHRLNSNGLVELSILCCLSGIVQGEHRFVGCLFLGKKTELMCWRGSSSIRSETNVVRAYLNCWLKHGDIASKAGFLFQPARCSRPLKLFCVGNCRSFVPRVVNRRGKLGSLIVLYEGHKGSGDTAARFFFAVTGVERGGVTFKFLI